MGIESLKITALLITGAMIPIMTTHINNLSHRKRNLERFSHERKIEKEKRQHEGIKEHHRNLINKITKIHALLNFFEHSISLTSSVIDSSRKHTPEKHDIIYRNELVKMIELKSIVIANFLDLYGLVLAIEGNHNWYWGHQRLLLFVDINEDPENYRVMQKKIVEIVNETQRNIYKVIDSLIEYSNNLNKIYLQTMAQNEYPVWNKRNNINKKAKNIAEQQHTRRTFGTQQKTIWTI